MGLALLDAFEATGNIVYRMMAEELALYAVRTMWDDVNGGFFDRAAGEGNDAGEAGDIGLLRQRHMPFVANCTAARLLDRLARAAENADYAALAGRTLAALSARAAGEGVHAAEYVLALKSRAR